MTREEVIKRFCALSTKVMEKQFNYLIPADCFCGEKAFGGAFDSEIVEFIESAVEEKLAKGKIND